MNQSNYQTIYHHLDEGENDIVIEQCLKIPDLTKNSNICYLLGIAYSRKGQYKHAEKYLKHTIQLTPKSHSSVCALGHLYHIAGHQNKAIQQFEQAIKINPHLAQTYCDLGIILMKNGEMVKACKLFNACLTIDSKHTTSAEKLGSSLINLGQYLQAIEILQRSLSAVPDQAKIYNCLSYAYEKSGDLTKAENSIRKAIELKPDSPEAYNNLGNILKARGKADEAIACFRKALLINPEFSGINSNLLLCMNYVPSISLNEIFEEHIKWSAQFDKKLHSNEHCLKNIPGRKIRIGYVSPDFRIHPVIHFFFPIISNHNKHRFELHCYAEVENPDWFTREVEKFSDGWTNTYGMKDHVVADKIRSDNIDILIDLAGHTGGHRLGVFTLKPAAIQATYLGYPNTTGLKTIDYRITDDILDPVGSDDFYTEKLIRLKNGFSCYSPPQFYPDVADLPYKKNGFITFGSFNNPAKFNTHIFSVWSQILALVADSRILFYRNTFSQQEKESLTKTLAQEGINPNRVTILNKPMKPNSKLPPIRRYMEVMTEEVDICLDTFPWNGHTTACESLWMGVPVVTLYGDRPSSRLCSSILRQLGLSHLTATNENDYVSIATNLAMQPDKLAEFRSNLRQHMKTSILCNGELFTRSLEQSYEKMLDYSIKKNSSS